MLVGNSSARPVKCCAFRDPTGLADLCACEGGHTVEAPAAGLTWGSVPAHDEMPPVRACGRWGSRAIPAMRDTHGLEEYLRRKDQGGTVPAPDSSYTLFNDPDDILAKAARLVDLVQSGLPGLQHVEPNETMMWERVLGPALLVKASGTLESMMLLLPSHRGVDAITLLRALFENTVVLSWMAADPAVRVQSWYRTSAFRELREREDWMKAGAALRSSAEAKEFKEMAGSPSERLPTVPRMAQEADECWGGVVSGWSRASGATDPGLFSSLRGLYRYVYQRGSAATHSAARGLDPFLSGNDDEVIVGIEDSRGDYHVYALGLYSLAFAIMASERSLGWPSWRQAARILERETAVFGT
jgi:hypothetical protein